MPANVQESFARGVTALFADAEPKKTEEHYNIFKRWNNLASKFPRLYAFAEFSRRARAMEEKLLLFHKLDPRSEADRETLSIMFLKHLETDTASTLEWALNAWWAEISHD